MAFIHREIYSSTIDEPTQLEKEDDDADTKRNRFERLLQEKLNMPTLVLQIFTKYSFKILYINEEFYISYIEFYIEIKE